MTEQQKAKFVASLVEHQSEFSGLTNEEAQWGIQNTKDMIAVMVSAIKKVCAKASSCIATIYRLVMDGSSISALLKAGSYDWVNENITDQNFPATIYDTVGEKEVATLHFNRAVSSEDAIAGMKTEGYRPATMRELLTFGKENPEVQRKFPIVALGQVVELDGYRHVGYLHRGGSQRDASLYSFGGKWGGNCRFLAVRI